MAKRGMSGDKNWAMRPEMCFGQAVFNISKILQYFFVITSLTYLTNVISV